MTCLKGFGQFGAKGLGQEGGGDGAGEADQHHDHVRDLDRGGYFTIVIVIVVVIVIVITVIMPGRSAS